MEQCCSFSQKLFDLHASCAVFYVSCHLIKQSAELTGKKRARGSGVWKGIVWERCPPLHWGCGMGEEVFLIFKKKMQFHAFLL